MAILRFRTYWEEDESIYRDVAIRHSQTFFDLHEAILKSYEFDNKHKATFYRSNDNWQRGREISLEQYDKTYQAAPLIMSEVPISSEVKGPNQKFIYEYDFNKNWHFMVELHLRPISLTKDNITDSAIRRLLFDAGDDLESLMILCKADITSKNPHKVKRFVENFEMVQQLCTELEARDHIRNWQPPVTGEVIMQSFNLPPSKPVGVLKDAIRNAILDGDIPNDYDAAIAFMHRKAAELGIG